MTQELAYKIADLHKEEIHPMLETEFIGIMDGDYLFRYKRTMKCSGHVGRSLFSVVTKNGDWRMLNSGKDETKAIIFHANILQKNT